MGDKSQKEVPDTVQYRVWFGLLHRRAFFSAVGNIVTNKYNRLSGVNVHNVVFLNGCHGVG